MKHTQIDCKNAEDQSDKCVARQTAQDVTDTVDDLRKSGGHMVTYPWPGFLRFKRRGEMPSAFVNRVKKTLAAQGCLVAFGRTVVVVMNDCNFSPVK